MVPDSSHCDYDLQTQLDNKSNPHPDAMVIITIFPVDHIITFRQ
jgi:hypothetical protein